MEKDRAEVRLERMGCGGWGGRGAEGRRNYMNDKSKGLKTKKTMMGN